MTLLLALLSLAAPQARPDTSFATLVAQLSERGGFFDTDNLVSNEQSYLHVVGALKSNGVTGGAYIGVGPDQNFSYIAAVRPAIALIIDIRRDNMLLQLVFRDAFLRAHNRLEYLCILFGRPVPANLASWDDRPLEDVIQYVDTTRARAAGPVDIRRFGVPLDSQDLAKIAAMRREYATNGLDIRLQTFNRPLRLDYPTYRQLLLEKDLEGNQASYLVHESDFRFVQQMMKEDRIIPVVGDLSGGQAMPAIARFIKERGLVVSAFYTSNVEQYLMRDGSFTRFTSNVAQLPSDARSVIIRSYFPNRLPHPAQVPGYNTVQVLQLMTSFQKGLRGEGYQSYFDLVTRDVLDLRAGRPTR